MRKIILCVLLFASFIFAQNCRPISDEFKSYKKKDMWNSKHVTMLVQNGVECDNGIFYNVYYPTETISSGCFYENWKTNEKTAIMNYNDINSIIFYKFDEFGMPIYKTKMIKTSKTCTDLYKQFKKEML